MPHAVTHKDTQPIASHQAGNGHVHFLFSPRAMEWIGNGVLDRFLEDESLFGEFLRTPVSEGGVESLVVEPPHIVVEVGA